MNADSSAVAPTPRRGPRWRALGSSIKSPDEQRLVVGVAALMIALVTAFRGWALYSSWFYRDDFKVLVDAQRADLRLEYLFQPHDTHLMPGGRLIAWLISAPGDLSWGLAATTTLVLQTVAAVSAVWMLTRLFGPRWETLALLGLYLTSAMTVPAMMWWTSSVNQVPLQISFFLAVGAWAEYLRGRRLRWLAATFLAVAFGLFFFVKTLLVVGVLGYLAVAYFATGSPLTRFRTVARHYWPAVVAGGALVGGYLAYYTTNVRQPFVAGSSGVAGELADAMLGTAFATGVVGGPWDWNRFAPPGSVADPPGWLVHLSWVILAVVILYAFLRRERTLRSWALLAIYLVALLLLLVSSRAPMFGPIVGLEYRYLTDATCVAVLCLGLAFLPLRGAVESSRPRSDPLLRRGLSTPMLATAVCLACASGLFSSARYIDYWHRGNASDFYVHTLDAELRTHGAVDLADDTLPEAVIPRIFTPDNTLSAFVPLLFDGARFPAWSSELATVASDGTLRQAVIKTALEAPGKSDGCGWLVKDRGRTINFRSEVFPWVWWIRIGYLGSHESPVTITAGDETVEATVHQGLNNLFVRVQGAVDSVRIDGLDDDVSMCVDTVEVGSVVPGERL